LDCPRDEIELRCEENTIYNYTTSYKCVNPGQDDSLCVGKSSKKPVDICEDWEDCVRGRCVRVYGNECDMECENEGYERYYCSDAACTTEAVEIEIRYDCDNKNNCCCII